MIKIRIEDAAVETQQVNGRNGSFLSSRQFGWVETPSGERRRIRINVGPKGPMPVGEYTIGDASFVIDNYGSLGLGRLELEPVAQVRPATVAGARAS